MARPIPKATSPSRYAECSVGLGLDELAVTARVVGVWLAPGTLAACRDASDNASLTVRSPVSVANSTWNTVFPRAKVMRYSVAGWPDTGRWSMKPEAPAISGTPNVFVE